MFDGYDFEGGCVVLVGRQERWRVCDIPHVLPKGFTRIRSYGFLANRGKAEALAKIRASLRVQAPALLEEPSDAETVAGPHVCSSCGGNLIPLVTFPRRSSPELVAPLEGIDSP